MKSLYLLINLFSFIIPFIFSFHPRIKFYKEWKFVLPGILVSGLVYLSWDIYFAVNAYWGFNPLYITGYHIFELPIEEVLFFFCIPYASLFMHFCICKFFPNFHVSMSSLRYIVFSIIVFLLLGVVFNYTRAYTLVNFILTIIILLVTFTYRPILLKYFLATFVFVLIPFFVVNGLLTGSFIHEQVVWYNDMENLGIRIGTVPIEDVFYALGMLLLAQLIADLIRVKAEYLKKEKHNIN